MTERAQKFGRPRIRLDGETEQEPLRNLELWDLVLLYSKALKGTQVLTPMAHCVVPASIATAPLRRW